MNSFQLPFRYLTYVIVAALRATSTGSVVYAELPGGQHSFDLFHSIRFEIVIDGIEDFAAWVRPARGAHRTDDSTADG